MRRITLLFCLLLSLVAALVTLKTSAVSAKDKEYSDEEIPEANGDYKLKDHPGMKVRVFVHKERVARDTSAVLVCSPADPDSSAVVAPTGWYLPSSWTYRLNVASVPSSVGGGNLATIASDAFARWKSASGDAVNFARGADTSLSRRGFDGSNIIAWGRTSGSALGVTYTWYYVSSGLAAETDTIMNKKYLWNWTPYSSSACVSTNYYDAQNILTHELGHWTGLDDHYTSVYVDNTMYGYGSRGEIKKDTLTGGDSSGIYDIYH